MQYKEHCSKICILFIITQYRNLSYTFSEPDIDFGLQAKFRLAQSELRFRTYSLANLIQCLKYKSILQKDI